MDPDLFGYLRFSCRINWFMNQLCRLDRPWVTKPPSPTAGNPSFVSAYRSSSPVAVGTDECWRRKGFPDMMQVMTCV